MVIQLRHYNTIQWLLNGAVFWTPKYSGAQNINQF